MDKFSLHFFSTQICGSKPKGDMPSPSSVGSSYSQNKEELHLILLSVKVCSEKPSNKYNTWFIEKVRKGLMLKYL